MNEFDGKVKKLILIFGILASILFAYPANAASVSKSGSCTANSHWGSVRNNTAMDMISWNTTQLASFSTSRLPDVGWGSFPDEIIVKMYLSSGYLFQTWTQNGGEMLRYPDIYVPTGAYLHVYAHWDVKLWTDTSCSYRINLRP
jgi:hypothetical protein